MTIRAGWVVESPTSTEFTARAIDFVLVHKRTQFQELYLVSTAHLGKALVLDGKWQSCVADEFVYHEALVHPAMAFHASAARVLILGGAEGATAREVARWPNVEQMVMVDIDAEVVAACNAHLPEMHCGVFDDHRLNVVADDAMNFLSHDPGGWDVIIADLCDPVDEGPSVQLFTLEAFSTMARHLNPSGILAVQSGPAIGRGFPAVVATLQRVFSTVLPYSITVPSYPGPWAFAVATSAPFCILSDKIISERLRPFASQLRCLDAEVLNAMFVLPRHIRQLVEHGRGELSTAEAPISFF